MPPPGTLINANLGMAVLVAIVHNTAMIAAGRCSASRSRATGLHPRAIFRASMTDRARQRGKESDDQLVEDPAGVAQFSIALFCL